MIFSFISIEESGLFSTEVVVLISGLLLLLILSRSKFIDRKLSAGIDKALQRYTDLDVRDYYSLLHLEEDYRVSELKATGDDWLSGENLNELQLDAEGVRVLGIRRENGNYIGAPVGKTRIKKGDIVILYGKTSTIQSIEKRKKGSMGESEHREEVNKQEIIEKEQENK